MNRKKFLAAALAGAVFFGNVYVYAANFSDINNVPWEGAKTYINSVADLGLMVGDYDSKNNLVFRSKDGVTYCETMQLVYSLVQKTGGTSVSSGVQSKWTSVMNGYKIPSWAQPAVAYGLENGIITISDIPGFVSKGSAAVNASRQDVAVMFGRALKSYGSLNSNASLSFNDKSSISSVAVPYVDLLVKLGVINGDSNNNFNPRSTINRAEMAVIMSKSYDVIKKGPQSATGSVAGKVTAVEQAGTNTVLTVNDGNKDYSFTGADTVPVLDGSTRVLISTVKVGYSVSVSYNGQNITSVLITSKGSGSSNTSSSKTVEGSYYSMGSDYIKVTADGDTKSYDFVNRESDEVRFYVDSDETSYNRFKEAADKGKAVKLNLNSDGQVVRAYLEDEIVGDFVSVASDYIKIKVNGSTETYYFEDKDKDNCKFYIDGDKTTYSKFDSKAKSRYTVRLTVDDDDYVEKADLITKEEESDDVVKGEFSSINSRYVRIKKDNGKTQDYYFEDDDSDNTDFYYEDRKRDYDYIRKNAEKGESVRIELNGDDEAVKVWISSDGDDEDGTVRGEYVSMTKRYIKIEKSSGSTAEYDFEDEDSDNVTFYYEDKRKDYDYIKERVERGDSVKLEFESGEVIKVWVESDDDDDDDDDDDGDDSGDLKSISERRVKIGNKTYDFEGEADDIRIRVKDGNEDEITDYDELREIVHDDGKIVYADITLNKSDEVTRLDGYVKTAEGELTDLKSSSIKVEFSSGSKVTYDYDSDDVDFKVSGSFNNSYSGLKNALESSDIDYVTVTITFDKNGEITRIKAEPEEK